jgi:hypothetical protein
MYAGPPKLAQIWRTVSRICVSSSEGTSWSAGAAVVGSAAMTKS